MTFALCRKRQEFEHGLDWSNQAYAAISSFVNVRNRSSQPAVQIDRTPTHPVGYPADAFYRIAEHSHHYVRVRGITLTEHTQDLYAKLLDLSP